jgi:hypothetical protein
MKVNHPKPFPSPLSIIGEPGNFCACASEFLDIIFFKTDKKASESLSSFLPS